MTESTNRAKEENNRLDSNTSDSWTEINDFLLREQGRIETGSAYISPHYRTLFG